MMRDRRAFIRLEKRFKVRFARVGPDGKPERKRLTAWTDEVSMGGLRLKTRGKGVELNQRLHLEIELLQPLERLEVVGRVVWIQQPEGSTTTHFGVFLDNEPTGWLLAWRKALLRRVPR